MGEMDRANFKLVIQYIKNVLFYVKNYKKILGIYEDEVSKEYVKEYIKNRIISPLYYYKILNCDKNEVNEI